MTPLASGRVAGRRFLVTGAASGIGLATTRLLVAEGAVVAMLDRAAEPLANAAREFGASVMALEADVAREDQVLRTVRDAGSHMGGIDGIVNSAGISQTREFSQVLSSEWHDIIAVNLSGPFHVCKAAFEFLREAGAGTIVNIASGVALRPIPGTTPYAASKAGLIGFGKALAVDLAPLNIRVNTVCPGIIETPMIRRRIDSAENPQEELRRLFERRLIRRFGSPEEIAQSVLFLSAPESSYVTGSVFAIDGGGTMH